MLLGAWLHDRGLRGWEQDNEMGVDAPDGVLSPRNLALAIPQPHVKDAVSLWSSLGIV